MQVLIHEFLRSEECGNWIELTKIGSKKRREEYRGDFIGHGWRREASKLWLLRQRKNKRRLESDREKVWNQINMHQQSLIIYLFIYYGMG